MSENTPSLSAYFGDTTDSKADNDFSSQLVEKISVLDIDEPKATSQSEPNVCRLFAKTPQQLKDPAASFFDLIGTSTSSPNAPTGMLTDLGLPSSEVSDIYTV